MANNINDNSDHRISTGLVSLSIFCRFPLPPWHIPSPQVSPDVAVSSFPFTLTLSFFSPSLSSWFASTFFHLSLVRFLPHKLGSSERTENVSHQRYTVFIGYKTICKHWQYMRVDSYGNSNTWHSIQQYNRLYHISLNIRQVRRSVWGRVEQTEGESPKVHFTTIRH